MELTRREFVWLGLAGVGAAMAGCATTNAVGERPDPWPELNGRPQTNGQGVEVSPRNSIAQVPGGPIQTQPSPGNSTVKPLPLPSPGEVTGPIKAISRSQWAEASPIGSKIQAMGQIQCITVHHEGWTPVYFTDASSTSKRLESIRRSHLERLGAGDIGYHYIIDRAGRIWQGRDIRYQGAHVREHNPHNIGVMCLGNFDLQRPTNNQLSTLQSTLASLMKQYRVGVKLVYTHQELNPTECPGTALQSTMVTLRRNGIV